MALQGTIKDFGLPDIFQLIGIQRKTGVLRLENGKDSVTIKFLDGQVAGADTRTESLEDRLGRVLVRTGRVTQAQLDQALETQKKTLQRLGYIMVSSGFITEEDLVEGLRVQSSQIIYRLFRWNEGAYNFDPVENLEYDEAHFVPISSETILMEGARMIDEWPIIERRIPTGKVVLRKTDALAELDAEVEDILEDDLDLDLKLGFADEQETEAEAQETDRPEIKLSKQEHEVLALIDGERSVGEVCDLLNLGEFDTYRILSEMLTRNLVEKVERLQDAEAEARQASLGRRLATWAIWAVLAAGVAAGAAGLERNPFTPWRLIQTEATSGKLRYFTSVARLERLERALQVFYLDTGTFPPTLALLAANAYVGPGDLVDPWGRAYGYQLSSSGYRLSGLDAGGQEAPELTVARRFNEVQTMMHSSGED